MFLQKRGQIAIFIIISIIVISLLIFLFSFDFEEKKEKLDSQEGQNLADFNGEKLDFLKDNIDFCLKKQLMRAVIISGARGGFIYEYPNENYLNGVIPEGVYESNLLESLDVSRSYLSSKTLVYSKYKLRFPEFSNALKYNHTISEDYEKFILDEFLRCIDLEGLEQKGYNIIYDQYSGKSIYFDGNSVVIDEIIGDIDDTVETSVEGKRVYGKIMDVNKEEEQTTVLFDGLEIMQDEIYVRNSNSSIDVDVIFNDDSVVAELSFPITIEYMGKKVSYKYSKASVNVRFKKLYDLARTLLYEKYENNRSMDITDPSIINKVIKGDIGVGLNYFSYSNENDFTISKFYGGGDDSYAGNVYSIVDRQSQIVGEPYVFNFAYENHAPVLVEDSLASDAFLSYGELVFLTAKNTIMRVNLRKIFADPQLSDNYKALGENHFYFEPYEYNGVDATFNLLHNGSLEFFTSFDNIFSYTIYVTDGETRSDYTLVFVSGIPDNSNNRAALDCFEFIPTNADGAFPISRSFLSSTGTFERVLGGEHVVFAFNNYLPSSLSNYKSKLFFKKSCMGPTGVEVRITSDPNLGTFSYDQTNEEITLNGAGFQSFDIPVEITVEVLDSFGNGIIEPYKIKVLPVGCMGPDPFDSELESIFGGDGSCCDLQQLQDIIDGSSPLPTSKVSNLNSGDLIIDVPVLIGPDLEEGNLEDVNIWDLGLNKIFKGNLEAKCSGRYPAFYNNLNRVYGGSTHLNVEDVIYDGNSYGPFGNANVDVYREDGVCEFTVLDQESSGIETLFKIDGVNYAIVIDNENAILSEGTNIPNNVEYANTFIFCDDNWYVSSTGNDNDWSLSSGTEIDTSNIDPEQIHVSKGYCYQGSSTCSGRKNSPTYDFDSDSRNTCINKKFNTYIMTMITKPGISGWVCSSSTQNIDCINQTDSTDVIVDGGTCTSSGTCNGVILGSCPSPSSSATCPSGYDPAPNSC